MRWLSRQSTFKVGKRKTENVHWFSIRIFPFVKLGIGAGAYPPGGRWGAGGGGSRGPCMPLMGPQIHGWDSDIATGSPYGRRLEKPIRGLLAPAMLRQRMGGAGIRLHSTLLKRSPMTVRLPA